MFLNLPDNRLLVRLFNVLLALIFLFWVLFDGTIRLLKKCITLLFKQEPDPDMKPHSTKQKPLLVAGAVAILMLVTVPVIADDVDYIQARKLQGQGQILSFEKIAEHARAVKPGDILETELELKAGRYIYEVEILDDKGVVWELKLNAQTGELIKIELDD